MSSRKIVIAGIISATILSATVVSAWTGPTASPPNANVSAPINVGSTAQSKNGNIGVNGLAVFGNTLLQASAYLNWGLTAGTSGYGIRDTAGTLEFKNSGGSWASLQSLIFAGGSQWTAGSGGAIYYNGGNVGIGTAAPYHYAQVTTAGTSYKNLEINGDNGGVLTLAGLGTRRAIIFTAASHEPTSGLILQTLENSDILFRANNSEAFRITAGGNVGIGTANPSSKLDVSSSGDTRIRLTGGGGSWELSSDNGSNLFRIFTAAGSARLAISPISMTSSGDLYAPAFLYSSDARLKENIMALKDGLTQILALSPVSFTWKSGPQEGKEDIGFLAQDVEKVIPGIVHTDDQAEDTDLSAAIVDHARREVRAFREPGVLGGIPR